tara:strand:- start:12191 stop:12427 length:237 start_codon:yes stop_codon:yes gene_type:complete
MQFNINVANCGQRLTVTCRFRPKLLLPKISLNMRTITKIQNRLPEGVIALFPGFFASNADQGTLIFQYVTRELDNAIE